MTSGRLPPPSGAQGERLRPENPGDAASGRRPASPRRPAASRGLRLRPPPRPAPPGHSRALLQAVTALAATPKSCAGDSAFTGKKGEDFTLDAGWATRGHVYGAKSPRSLLNSQHDVGLARTGRERTVRTPPHARVSVRGTGRHACDTALRPRGARCCASQRGEHAPGYPGAPRLPRWGSDTHTNTGVSQESGRRASSPKP